MASISYVLVLLRTRCFNALPLTGAILFYIAFAGTLLTVLHGGRRRP